MLRTRTRGWFVTVAGALVLAVGIAGRADAAPVALSDTTYDRPGISEDANGNFDIAWAGSDTNGTVHLATVDPTGKVINRWTDTSTATYLGTGVTVAYDPPLHYTFVAWTDLAAKVHVAVEVGGLSCETTTFGSSVDTPYLTVAADGTLYLTTVDAADRMHVTEVDNRDCIHEGYIGGPNTLAAGPSTTVAGNTSYNGPALVDLNLTGRPNLWLVWAGTNSAHNINVASFTPGNPNLGVKWVESAHATITDMGATTYVSNGTSGAFFTYCGTNNVVYGQSFFGLPQPERSLGGTCAIYTTYLRNAAYVNGGVDVTSDGRHSTVHHLYPNQSNSQLTLGSYAP